MQYLIIYRSLWILCLTVNVCDQTTLCSSVWLNKHTGVSSLLFLDSISLPLLLLLTRDNNKRKSDIYADVFIDIHVCILYLLCMYTFYIMSVSCINHVSILYICIMYSSWITSRVPKLEVGTPSGVPKLFCGVPRWSAWCFLTFSPIIQHPVGHVYRVSRHL